MDDDCTPRPRVKALSGRMEKASTPLCCIRHSELPTAPACRGGEKHQPAAGSAPSTETQRRAGLSKGPGDRVAALRDERGSWVPAPQTPRCIETTRRAGYTPPTPRALTQEVRGEDRDCMSNTCCCPGTSQRLNLSPFFNLMSVQLLGSTGHISRAWRPRVARGQHTGRGRCGTFHHRRRLHGTVLSRSLPWTLGMSKQRRARRGGGRVPSLGA